MELRPTWYARTGRLGEFWTILHLPYTLMVLSYVLIGAFTGHNTSFFKLFWTVLAYFLGLGIGAHALDQISNMGSRYVRTWSDRELLTLAVFSLSAAVVIGGYFAMTLDSLLWLFISAETFFAIAYPCTKLFRGFFHKNLWFCISWGALPYLTSYYLQNRDITLNALVMSIAISLTALIEIIISRWVRWFRKNQPQVLLPTSDTYVPMPVKQLIAQPEKALKTLTLAVYLLAVALSLSGIHRLDEVFIFPS